MGQPNITILDGELNQRVGFQLKEILQREGVYKINIVGASLIGQSELRSAAPSLIIPVLPPTWKSARQLLSELRPRHSPIPLLPVITSDALDEGFAVGLVDTQDFLVMPLRAAEVSFRVRRLAGGDRQTSTPIDLAARGLAQMIGEHPAFVTLKRKISSVARFESTVLLTGETGTGKERFARTLHYSSRRAGNPFLAVNCGAIPEHLFESELYGHRKGAFTGACAAQPGLIAEAENGTLFLDEIETLSLPGQVKLLRFLQDQTYYPVGSARPRKANVWILASTNVELPRKIQEGTFREDLFYRLAVITLVLPPLRERKSDIPLLAAHFWKLYSARAGRGTGDLSPEVTDALCQHAWPGNVRELENVVQQLAVLTESEDVRPEDVPIPRVAASRSHVSFAQKKAHIIEEFERGYISELLRLHRGNVTRAAQEAGKDRRALGRLIKKYRIAKT
jgi:two-component system response regulator AtoC